MRQKQLVTHAYPKSGGLKLCKSALFRSWWVLLLLILGSTLYSHAMQKKEVECAALRMRKAALEEQRALLLQEQADLRLQVSSQSDPAWVELVLMKRLGLVPEGQRKVYFRD